MGDHDNLAHMIDKAFRAGITGQRFIDIMELESMGVITDTNGPCERYMTGIKRMDGLKDTKSAYSVGRALLITGTCLDGLWYGIRSDTSPAKKFFEDLQREVHKHNTTEPDQAWTGKHTVEYFGNYPVLPDGESLKDADPKRWNDLQASMIRQLDGPSGNVCAFSHPTLAAVFDDIVPITPSYHLTAEQYFELEGAMWDRIDTRWIPNDQAFVIYVDGNAWFSTIDDNRYQYRTDLLFAGFANHGALVVERVSATGPGLNGVDIRAWGVDFDRRTGALQWRSSMNATVKGKREMFTPSDREKARMFRVALGFTFLLQHPNVTTTPTKVPLSLSKHFRLSMPEGLTIDDAISSVIAAKWKVS